MLTKWGLSPRLFFPTRRRLRGDSPPSQARSPPHSSRCGPPAALPRPSRHSAESPRPSLQPRPSPHSAESRADCTQASCSLSRAPRVRTGRIVNVPGLEGHCKENTRTWWADAVRITWGSGSTVWSPDAILGQVVFGFSVKIQPRKLYCVREPCGWEGQKTLLKMQMLIQQVWGSLNPPWVSKKPLW